MPFENLVFQGKELLLVRAVVDPNFGQKKVLTSDPWEYVDLWLRRNRNLDAAFFWQQSRQFYRASLELPATAAPLPLYYCFLNATKALLVAKGVKHSAHHGLSGYRVGTKASLQNEKVKLKRGGVLPALMSYYGETETTSDYSLKEIFYNLAYIHRAYSLTYRERELFISIHEPRYVRKEGSSETWICAESEVQYDDDRVLRTLPPGYEKDLGSNDDFVLRRKKRFKWSKGKSAVALNLKRISRYHAEVRRDITYVAGVNRWYLKRRLSTATIIDRHAPVLIQAAMHRLSELSRYDPLRLSRLLDTHRNWLLSEFIRSAPHQFIDEIACEITGEELFAPQIHVGGLL